MPEISKKNIYSPQRNCQPLRSKRLVLPNIPTQPKQKTTIPPTFEQQILYNKQKLHFGSKIDIIRAKTVFQTMEECQDYARKVGINLQIGNFEIAKLAMETIAQLIRSSREVPILPTEISHYNFGKKYTQKAAQVKTLSDGTSRIEINEGHINTTNLKKAVDYEIKCSKELEIFNKDFTTRETFLPLSLKQRFDRQIRKYFSQTMNKMEMFNFFQELAALRDAATLWATHPRHVLKMTLSDPIVRKNIKINGYINPQNMPTLECVDLTMEIRYLLAQNKKDFTYYTLHNAKDLIRHEIGHLQFMIKGEPYPEKFANRDEFVTAAEVSDYATTSISEFMAETYAQITKGRSENLSPQVIELFKKYGGERIYKAFTE